jgi:hypothetical protein
MPLHQNQGNHIYLPRQSATRYRNCRKQLFTTWFYGLRLRPRAPMAEFRAEFFPFANINNTIRLREVW